MVVLGAGILERMRPERLAVLDRELDIGSGRTGVSGRGEMGADVRQDDVNPVGDGLDQGPQEVAGNAAGGFLMQFDEGELRGSINGHQKVELALLGANLGDIDVEKAERIDFELALVGLVAVDARQAGDAVTFGGSGGVTSG